MPESKFIVVIQTNHSHFSETELKILDNNKQVVLFIASLSDENVNRIFKVDEYGKVTFYEVKFNGRLELEEIKNA